MDNGSHTKLRCWIKKWNPLYFVAGPAQTCWPITLVSDHRWYLDNLGLVSSICGSFMCLLDIVTTRDGSQQPPANIPPRTRLGPVHQTDVRAMFDGVSNRECNNRIIFLKVF